MITCESKPKSKELLLAGTSVLVVTMIIASSLITDDVNVYAQNQNQNQTQTQTQTQNQKQKGTSSSDKPGNVVNSLYLSVTDSKYRTGPYSDTITGTITNNSTSEISSLFVYAALYTKDNKLITTESGSVSISPLRAGDSSPFDITIFFPSSARNQIDHYTIFPAGTPR